MPYSSDNQFILYCADDDDGTIENLDGSRSKDQNKYLEGPDRMDNSTVVSELKENFRLSQPTPSLIFGGILFLVVEATRCLLTIPS